MRIAHLIVFIITTIYCFGQETYLDTSKYSDCRLNIDIRHSKFKQQHDISIANQFSGQEIVVVDINRKGKINSFYRGFISRYDKSDARITFFEPIESYISFRNKIGIYIIYRSKKTFCYDASCYDEKNGIIKEKYELHCQTLNRTAINYFNRGNIASSKFEYRKAISWYTLAIKEDSTFCDGYNSLGDVLLEIGDFPGAIGCYENALKIDSLSFNSWINLYDTNMRIFGDTLASTTILNNMLKHLPEEDFGYHELYKIYTNLKEYEKAKEVILKARENNIYIEE